MPLFAHTYRDIRNGLGVLLVIALLFGPLAARAEGEDPAAIERVTALNKKALDAYSALEFEDARKLLKQALDQCSSSGLDKHPIKARTHIHMGVVLIATKQQELGVKQFRKALEIQPDIQVTKALANPEIIQAFEDAGTAGGAAAPPDARGTEPAAEASPEGGREAAPAQDISHVPVARGKKGKPVAISVTVSPDLTGYSKVVLAYRAEGGAEFMARDMRRSGSKFVGEIPADATAGNIVHYYVEAEADDETAVATTGSEEKPYSVSLSAGGRGGGGGGGGDDGEGEEEDEESGPPYFVSFLGGTGIGYATGNGEVNADNKVSAGFAPSSTAQIAPEVGYFLPSGLRISIQFRYQFISGPTPLNLARLNPPKMGCGSDNVCTPASSAFAVFARAAWFFGSGMFRPYFSLAAGVGQIRHVVKFTSLTMGSMGICGMNGGQVCVDTVLAGPIFAGPGGGVLINLTPNFGLVVEVGSVLGLPKFTYHLDLNAGVAARF